MTTHGSLRAASYLLLVVLVVPASAGAEERVEGRIDVSVRAHPSRRVRAAGGLETRLRNDGVVRVMPGFDGDVRVLPWLRLGLGYTYVLRLEEQTPLEHGHRLRGSATATGRLGRFELSLRSAMQWRLATDSRGSERGDDTNTYLRNRFGLAYRLHHHRELGLSVEHFLHVRPVDHDRVRLSLGFDQRVGDVDLAFSVNYDVRPPSEHPTLFFALGVRWAPQALDARRAAAEPEAAPVTPPR